MGLGIVVSGFLASIEFVSKAVCATRHPFEIHLVIGIFRKSDYELKNYTFHRMRRKALGSRYSTQREIFVEELKKTRRNSKVRTRETSADLIMKHRIPVSGDADLEKFAVEGSNARDDE